MIVADRPGQYHPDDVRRKHGFAARPDGETAHHEKGKQDELRFELRDASAVPMEESRRQHWKNDEHDDAHDDEYERADREGRKDQAQRDHGSEVIDETCGENGLADLRTVEPEFEHDCID